jgi:membrane protein YqaA with SNARE-associated domain
MGDLAIYLTLFSTAFAAATILPLQSEGLLVGLLLADVGAPVSLVAVASAGNVLGSTVNWLLGRAIGRFRDRPWFPVKETMLTRARGWYDRWGKWSLLLSWLPIIGDALTLAAGILRERLATFLALVTLAKTGRYVVLAAVVEYGWL